MLRLLLAFTTALCLHAGTCRPANASLAIVQFANGSQTSGTGVPGHVVFGSTPTVGDLIVVFLHVAPSTVVTINTGSWTTIGDNVSQWTYTVHTYTVYRYVQAGDTTSLPVLATAGTVNWTYGAYEISGVTGTIGHDLQTIGGVADYNNGQKIYPVFDQVVPQSSGALALGSMSNPGSSSVPAFPAAWSADLDTGSETNWGSVAAGHVASPTAGALYNVAGATGTTSLSSSMSQLILQTSTPGYPTVRQSYETSQGTHAHNSTVLIQGAPVPGNLMVAFVFGASGATLSTNWTQFSISASGNHALGIYRYVQGGDTATLPAFFTDASTSSWGYESVEVAGVTGIFANDVQSTKTGTASTVTSLATTSDTTLQPNTLALIGADQSLTTGGSTYPTFSNSFAMDGATPIGDCFTGSKTFASKSSSVTTTITAPASTTIDYIQMLIGAPPNAGRFPLLGVGP